jgi:hypothetical protein
LGILEGLRLLLKAGVREGLFKGDAVDEKRVLKSATGDFFYAYQLFVEVVRVEGEDGINDHCEDQLE